jgi:uncharacterized membrane protein
MPWWLYPLLVYVAVMAALLAILGTVMFGQWARRSRTAGHSHVGKGGDSSGRE